MHVSSFYPRLEENNIDVTINTGGGDSDFDQEDSAESVAETVDEVQDTTELDQTADDAEESAEDAKDASDAAEMLLHSLSEFYTYRRIAKTHGVDRTFLAIANSNDSLSELINVKLPGCESFDAIGNPRSAMSQQVVAGLEGAIQTAWEWIKNLFQKIWYAIRDFIANIVNFFTDVDKRISKLKEALGKLPADAKPADDRKIKGLTLQVFKDVGNKITSASGKAIGSDGKDPELPDLSEKRTEIELSKISRSDISQYITSLEGFSASIKTTKKMAEEMMKTAKKGVDNAKKNASNGGSEEEVKKAKEEAANTKKDMSAFTKCAKAMTSLLKEGLHVPTAWIRWASRNSSGKNESEKKTVASSNTNQPTYLLTNAK